MNYVFRALKSLKERLGRTVIIFAVMLTVCAVILSAFSIQSATDAAAIMARQKLGAEVSLTVDREKMMEKLQSQVSTGQPSEGGKPSRIKFTSTPIPLEYLDELKGSSYLINYSVSSTTGANLQDLLAVGVEESETSTETETSQPDGGFMGMAPGGQGGMMQMGSQGDVNLIGVNNFNTYSTVISGDIELIEGREITEDDIDTNVVLIEETFASENTLEVGSKFTIVDTEDETNTIEVEVVGIYKSNEEVDEMAYRMTSMLPYNKIYTSYTLVNTLKGTEYDNAVDTMKFYLDDPINVDAFIEEGMNTSIDFETYVLDGNNSTYETMMGPIENVASFSQTTLVLVMAFGGVILALIIMLSIKDRVNEIGILMSLGEKRNKIVCQFLVEVLVILLLSITVSGLFGNKISNIVGNKLIQNEIAVQEEEISSGIPGMPAMAGIGGTGGFKGMSGFSIPGFNSQQTNIEVIDDLDINMGIVDFTKMSALAVLLAIVATLIPSISIMRFNPKTILSKHS